MPQTKVTVPVDKDELKALSDKVDILIAKVDYLELEKIKADAVRRMLDGYQGGGGSHESM